MGSRNESSSTITESWKEPTLKFYFDFADIDKRKKIYQILKPVASRPQRPAEGRSDVMYTPQNVDKMNARRSDAATIKKIGSFAKSADYQIVQINGQRVYGPAASAQIPPPPKGTEIFIGNLPPDFYEDEIVPIFSRAGAIYNLRLMMDFFGQNRGYAFVAYFRAEDAHRAVERFDNYRVRSRTKLAVSMSVDNRRLFVGNIPRTISLKEIRQILERYVEGVTDAILYCDPYDDKLNRGFVFVEFQTHRLAAIARRQLSPGNLIIWGQPIFVDWAEPLPSVKPEIMKKVTKLYLSNVPPQLSTDQLKYILHELLGSLHILKVHKISDYAFVHFTVRRVAEEAQKRLQGLVIMNREIGVEWARPTEYSRNNRKDRFPVNYCKSVPPSMRKLVMQSLKSKNFQKKHRNSMTDESSVITKYLIERTDYTTYF